MDPLRAPRRPALAWGLTLGWATLIFWLSSRSDMDTVPLARRLGLLPWDLPPLAEDALELILRKGAHLLAYAVLAVLLRWAVRTAWPGLPARQAERWAWLGAVAYAVTDELHQAVVPGRDGRWLDVAIDAAGALAGLWLARRLAGRRGRGAAGGGAGDSGGAGGGAGDGGGAGGGPGAAAPARPGPSWGRRLLGLGAALAAVSLANRVASYGREAVLAFFLGAGTAADQYALAYTVSAVIAMVLGSAVGVVLVPRLVAREAAGDRAGARRLVAEAGGAVLALAVAAAAIMAAPAWQPAAWGALGAAGRWNWWGFAAGLPAAALFTLYGYVLNARDRYLAPVALPILLDAVVVAGFAAGMGRLGLGALGLSYAAGAAAILAVVAAQAGWLGVWRPPHPAGLYATPWPRVLPALATSSLPALLPLMARALALSLAAGDAAVLHYATLLTAVPVALLATPAATLMLPHLSRSAAADAALFRRQAAGSLAAVLALALPAAAGLAVLAHPVVALLFGRGALDPAAVGRVAAAVVALAPGIVGMAVFSVAQQGWYARGNTLAPLGVSALGVAVGVAAGLALRGEMGFVGLALGVSAGNLVAGGVLVASLHTRGGGALDAGGARFALRSLAATAVMVAAVWAWLRATAGQPALAVVAGGIPLGVAVYGLGLLGAVRRVLASARPGGLQSRRYLAAEEEPPTWQ